MKCEQSKIYYFIHEFTQDFFQSSSYLIRFIFFPSMQQVYIKSVILFLNILDIFQDVSRQEGNIIFVNFSREDIVDSTEDEFK